MEGRQIRFSFTVHVAFVVFRLIFLDYAILNTVVEMSYESIDYRWHTIDSIKYLHLVRHEKMSRVPMRLVTFDSNSNVKLTIAKNQCYHDDFAPMDSIAMDFYRSDANRENSAMSFSNLVRSIVAHLNYVFW